MTDLLDKAILIGMGLEKKAREAVEELQKAGKESRAGEGGLRPTQSVENRVVEEGVTLFKEFANVLKAARERVESGVHDSSEMVFSRLNVPTTDEIEVAKEMARVAREKVEALEKRLTELESRLNEK